MNDIFKTFTAAYNELIFSLVLYLRHLGLHFISVNIINCVLLLLLIIIAYKMFAIAKKAAIYLIILTIVLVPFLFLIISSFFINSGGLNEMIR